LRQDEFAARLRRRRHSAISKASITRVVSMRCPIDQPISCRENRSRTTARYSQPSWVRMQVMSVTQD
jgi:hypothetical protein